MFSRLGGLPYAISLGHGSHPTAFPLQRGSVYLLYVDGSGSTTQANESHFILAGVATFERQVYWQTKALDELAEQIDPHSPHEIEFHGLPILAGRKRWRRFQPPQRSKLLHDALRTLADAHRSTTIFGIAVNKRAISPRDPVEYAFEQLCNRYDLFLARKKSSGEEQRG